MKTKKIIKNTKVLVTKSFRELRTNGYFAKQNFWCCSTCAWSQVPEKCEKAVFYHHQDSESFFESGNLHIRWMGNRKFIEKIFRKNGLRIKKTEKPEEETIIVYKK